MFQTPNEQIEMVIGISLTTLIYKLYIYQPKLHMIVIWSH